MRRLQIKSPHSLKFSFGCILLSFFIACIIILALTPPVSRDALIHHLAIPKLYLIHGGIYEIPNILFSYYPMNLDLLYMIPLAFGNDILPKCIHFSFGLLTACLIYSYIKNRINRCYGLLGALFFLSIPITIKLSITVYVDLGLIFFSTASLLLLFQWTQKDYTTRLLILAGICCGLAVGTKYNGLISLLLLTMFVPILYIRSHKKNVPSSLPSLKYASLFTACALISCSPWLIRNTLWTGNPLYPLFDSLFNPTTAPASVGQDLGIFKIRQLIYQETPLQILLLPVRIFFEGQDNVSKLFDGKLSPFLLILPLLAFFPIKGNKQKDLEKILLATFSLLFFLFALFTADLRIRYISPIISPLVILSMFGLRNCETFLTIHILSKKIVAAGIALIVSVLLLPNVLYLYQQFQKIQPLEYISGKIDRNTYLTKHLPEYAVMSYANQHLPEHAKILCLYLAGRSYYLDRPAIFEPRYSQTFFNHMRDQSLPETRSYLQHEKINYLLIRDDLLKKTITESKDAGTRKKWYIFFNTCTKHVVTSTGYSLYEIILPPDNFNKE